MFPNIHSKCKIKTLTLETLVESVIGFQTIIKEYKCFIFSLMMSLVFYFPSLMLGSDNAGFLYMGDNIGFYLPALAKAHSLISSLNFTAIDFSSYNGSSDFFLAPNFFAVHPMVVIYSILVPFNTSSMSALAQFFVFMCAAHSFIACYFTIKLFTRFFSFGFASSALIAVIYAFSIYMVCALGEPEYLFCICVLPWVVYSVLNYIDEKNLKHLLVACLPIIGGVLGGYVPLALTGLILSLFLITAKLFIIDDSSVKPEKRITSFFVALHPFILSVLVLSPYLYSVAKFLLFSPSATRPDIFYSAHQLAEQPETLLRLFSYFYKVPGPFYEFSVLWGFIPLAIATIFLLSKKTINSVSPTDLKLFKLASALYFLTVLSIFGNFSVVSDLVYYLVPQIGKMHIYQRFLLPINLFFGLMVVIMLKSLIEVRPFNTTRNILVVFAIALLVATYLVSHEPVFSGQIGLNGLVIFELFLGFLFVFALFFPGRRFIFGVTIVLITLPPLNLMYDYSIGTNTLVEQKKRLIVALDEVERKNLITYLNRFSGKKIIKYVDLTPRWNKDGFEDFPKSFPYFILNDINLSSYTGFNFYLSTRNDYMLRMPVSGQSVALDPDWEMVKSTGADFLVVLDQDLDRVKTNSFFTNVNFDDMYRLPNGVVILPLEYLSKKASFSQPPTFDNGYFRVYPNTIESDQNLVNIAKGKFSRQSGSLGESRPSAGNDGNTDGYFNNGSVTHTNQDINAWYEIDIGKVEKIDSLKIWNRTDCCGYRLRDYWVFISELPFLPTDTAINLQHRSNVWAHHTNYTSSTQYKLKADGVNGRYVRIQLGGLEPLKESYLSLAEVEVFSSPSNQIKQEVNRKSDLRVNKFKTNNANYMRLNLQSSSPASVEYLFWNNPRLLFYLNGKPAKIVEREGLTAINIPAGKNIIEVRYRNISLTIFWIFYAAFSFALLFSLIPKCLLNKFFAGIHRR